MKTCAKCGATVLNGPGLTAHPQKDGKATKDSKWYCHIPNDCLAKAMVEGKK